MGWRLHNLGWMTTRDLKPNAVKVILFQYSRCTGEQNIAKCLHFTDPRPKCLDSAGYFPLEPVSMVYFYKWSCSNWQKYLTAET